MARELTLKQKRFVIEYLKDGHGTNAAIRAGYSRASAANIASENLTKPEIRDAVAGVVQAQQADLRIDADWVLIQLVKNFSRSMQAEPVLDREGHPTGEYKYQGAVANKSLELIAKHMDVRAFAPSQTELTGKDGGPLEIDHSHIKAELLATLEMMSQRMKAAPKGRVEAPEPKAIAAGPVVDAKLDS